MRVWVASALILLPMIVAAAENTTGEGVVHGTINVALGNKNGLVLLTDSMVTATDANGTNRQLTEPGQKLFKLDDHTVCSVAGFASAPAISGRVALPDLNTSTSAIIHEYIRQSAPRHRQNMAEQLRALALLFRMHLAMIASVRDTANPIEAYTFQLMIVGYDIDDRPKIGRMTIRIDNSRHSFSPEIEDFSLVDVEQSLVWQVSGMPDVATRILLHPESKRQDEAIRQYETSLSENGGGSLTVDEMVELAKRLEYYTSQVHPEVGGANQIAIFKNSQSVSVEQPYFPEPPHPLFRFGLIVDSHFAYSSVAIAKGTPAVFVRCSWVGMQLDLDGHYYIGSEFGDSWLTYDGGNINLGDTNKITNSLLILGPHAILESEVVRSLTAAFPSLPVTYAVAKPKPWQIVP